MNILITGCNGQMGNEMQLLEKENPQHTIPHWEALLAECIEQLST